MKKRDTPGFGGSRGIIDPAAAWRHFRHTRYPPSESLVSFVEHYWYIEWDLAEPHRQRILPHPSVHLTFHPEQTFINGVITGSHTSELRGRGRLLGVRFQPGGFGPFLSAPVSTITGRQLRIAEVFGPAGAELTRAVLAAADGTAMVALVDEFLRAECPQRSPAAETATAAVTAVAADPMITRVDQLAARLNRTPRSLQRLLSRYVGVGPKWVIRRCRIHEAVEQAGSGAAIDWARLAAALGYSDQAHFVNDFSRTVGVSPARYARLADPAA